MENESENQQKPKSDGLLRFLWETVFDWKKAVKERLEREARHAKDFLILTLIFVALAAAATWFVTSYFYGRTNSFLAGN